MNDNQPQHLVFKIRFAVGIFVLGLVLSGLTAFPLLKELNFLVHAVYLTETGPVWIPDALRLWILKVLEGLKHSYELYPFIAYGTDWLAFGHLAIAIFFIGVFVNPVRNKWVIYAGMAVCPLPLTRTDHPLLTRTAPL